MDATDLDLRSLFKQSLGNCQPPEDSRQQLLQAAANLRHPYAGYSEAGWRTPLYRSDVQASSQGMGETIGVNLPPRSNEGVRPLVRLPLFDAEKGWG
jgi:hypothetical protein